VEYYCSVGHATDDNMAHAHCILDTYGDKHVLRICYICFFSTATTIALTRLSVALYCVARLIGLCRWLLTGITNMFSVRVNFYGSNAILHNFRLWRTV
jgi:hypothetical protein